MDEIIIIMISIIFKLTWENFRKMKRLFVWPGGKSREFKNIENISKIKNKKIFAEPFVGSGYTFLNLDGYDKYLINDISEEVINVFHSCKKMDSKFIDKLKEHILNWENIESINFKKYFDNKKYNEMKNHYINKWGNNKLGKITFKKMLYYNVVRERYNENLTKGRLSGEDAADFMFLRQYCFSGMLRYSGEGKFNVPYGGFRYNDRSLKPKLDFILSKDFKNKMKNTEIFNESYETFLTRLDEHAFVFFDPPYDSEFTSYTDNEFTFEDQKKLASMVEVSEFTSYMIMLRTKRIYDLYKNIDCEISTVPYSYGINIKNRQEVKTRVNHIYVLKN